MNLQELEFWLAYADMYGYKDLPVLWVFDQLKKETWFNDLYTMDWSEEEIANAFLRTYNDIKKAGREVECKILMRYSDCTIWMAAANYNLV